MRQYRYFTAAMLLLAMVLISAPISAFGFEASAYVDKNKISADDTIMLQVEISGGKAEPDLSIVRDFKVHKRGTSSQINYINGKMDRKVTYQYLLVPVRTGNLIIPAIPVKGKGQQVTTDPVRIEVVAQSREPGMSADIFARAELSQENMVIGQPAVYSLKFFTSRQLSGLSFETPPDFGDLSVKPFEKQRNYAQRINGVQYKVTEVNYLVEPSRPGSYNIDPAVLMAQVVVESSRGRATPFDSFFNDSFFSSRVSAKPVRVKSNIR